MPAEIATGAFRSVEPADWPCALRQLWPGGEERRVHRLVYGARRECQIPVQMAFEGIVGCVDREVLRRNDQFYDLSRFSYAGGQIAQVENNGGVFRYDWEGGVPTLRGERPARRAPGRIERAIVDRDVIDVDARSRPLRRWTVHNDRVESSSELEWQAGRLVAVQHYTHDDGDVAKKSFRLELVFDCSALPTLTKSANADGPLGIPLQ